MPFGPQPCKKSNETRRSYHFNSLVISESIYVCYQQKPFHLAEETGPIWFRHDGQSSLVPNLHPPNWFGSRGNACLDDVRHFKPRYYKYSDRGKNGNDNQNIAESWFTCFVNFKRWLEWPDSKEFPLQTLLKVWKLCITSSHKHFLKEGSWDKLLC